MRNLLITGQDALLTELQSKCFFLLERHAQNWTYSYHEHIDMWRYLHYKVFQNKPFLLCFLIDHQFLL